MIQTVALTILMPITASIPTTPVRLPGPSVPVGINQSIRLPGPVLPIARVQLDGARPAPSKTAPSAIETLRDLFKDDRPLPFKKTFDNATLPEVDLANEIGLGR
ncbi:MAG: hypothetical protein HY077_07155 [Elusimicrobia bacterium]|nr:hypothetical protein [Elusimicrobiota bacterium]